MALIHDIKKQPMIIRQAMFGLSVVTALSLVGALWFNSFRRDVYVLLNPASQEESAPSRLADDSSSPLALISEAWSIIKADILEVFTSDGPRDEVSGSRKPPAPAQKLPISGEK